MKPLLVGMNNPLSRDPEDALVTWPDGCTGYRTWKLLSSGIPGGVTERQYLDAFDRTNLLPGQQWSDRAARTEAARFWPTMRGRMAVLFGQKVVKALGLDAKKLLEWQRTEVFDVHWIQLPHPSGLNRLYHDEKIRARASSILADLYALSNRG